MRRVIVVIAAAFALAVLVLPAGASETGGAKRRRGTRAPELAHDLALA